MAIDDNGRLELQTRVIWPTMFSGNIKKREAQCENEDKTEFVKLWSDSSHQRKWSFYYHTAIGAVVFSGHSLPQITSSTAITIIALATVL